MVIQTMKSAGLWWALKKRQPVLCGGLNLSGGSIWRQDLRYGVVTPYRYSDGSRPDQWIALFDRKVSR